MRYNYATEVACDACGTVVQLAYDGSMLPGTPPGWWGDGERVTWTLADPFGAQYRDICADCKKLPFADLVNTIITHMEAVRGGQR